MHIIHERPTDAAAIRRLTIAAFNGPDYSGEAEAGIVDALRADDQLSISMVACADDEVVGHVAFSPVAIEGVQGWYGLGPVSVLPARQRQGVGQALICAGLEALKTRGAGGCVLLGDPAYYGRFGFEADAAIAYQGESSPYLQRLVFSGPSPTGEVRYHRSFG